VSDPKWQLNRRDTLKLIASTAAVAPTLEAMAQARARSATDPDLLHPTVPWRLVLTSDELTVLAALSDVIIPADERSPSAATLGCHHFIDEYVSAPYPANQDALALLRSGLAWLSDATNTRFEQPFIALSAQERNVLCEEIKWIQTASKENLIGAEFFALVRNLVSAAFWTTLEGMADLGYVGNRPSVNFDGPDAELLAQIGVKSL
jgi:gluconate 2-dehydrogenase gamma chain